ncbi:MAG: DUF4157 domain-containing protein [Gemmatimonadaceae bacterium]
MERARMHRGHRHDVAHDSSAPRIAPHGGGRALDQDHRTALEPRFGHSFANVRVVLGDEADQLTQEFDARAVTVGQDVFFGEDQYQPETAEGMYVLAHELAHTIQQPDAAPTQAVRRDTSGEREARDASDAIMRGSNVSVTKSCPASAQCFGWDDDFGLKPIGSWLGGLGSDVADQTKPNGSNPAAAAGVDMAKKGTGAFGLAQKAADFLTKELVPDANGEKLVSQSNPIVGGIGTALKGLNVGLDVASSKADGQGWGEALSGGAGKLVSSFFGTGVGTYGGDPTNVVDTRNARADSAINIASKVAGMANEGAKAMGMSKSVTDTTQGVADGTSLAADVTPSSMQENILKQGFRGLWNIGSGVANSWDQIKEGDYEGALLKGGSQVDKQVTDMKAGKSGAPLQGYAMMADIIPDLLSGKDFESTLLKTGSQGSETTAAGRAGSWLGDQAYQIVNKDLPELSEFAGKDIKKMLDWF